MKRFLLNTLRSSTLQACAFALLLVIIFYGKFLFHPGSYLLSVSPDGVKGYYTYAWQINNATSPFEFTGMNYPVGEHMLVTDGHTSVSLLSWIFPFLKHFPVETINLLMLLGLVLTAGILCALLREWGANHTFAVVGAVVITFLSPTVIRMTGHFSLSHGFIIPLGMLWWTRLVKTGKYFSYSWKIRLLVLIFFFTHAYMGMMLAAFIFLAACCTVLFDKTEIKKTTFWLAATGATLIPVLLFMAFMTITETHVNRPETPSGFFENFAAWKGIFLPVTGFFKEWINTKIDLSAINFEKWAYLGTASLFSCILGLLLFFRPARVGAAEGRKPVSFFIFIIPAILLTLFAAGFPFRIYPHMADWVSFVKQFRVMARFAWPLYFVAGLYAVLVVQHVWNKEKLYAAVKYGLVGGVLILALLDIIAYNHFVLGGMGNNPNIFNRSQINNDVNKAIDVIKKENPDFLIVFPYFHVGSEMYTRSGTDKSRQIAFTFSYHSAKPLLNVELSRTSITETERLFEFFAPRYALKEWNENYLKGKVVLIDTKEGTTYREREMLKDCKLIYEGKTVSIYTAQAKKLFKYERFEPLKNKKLIIGNNDILRIDSLDVVHYLPHERVVPMRNYTVLDTFTPNQLQKDSLYHISFHFKTEKGARKGGMLVVQTIDKNGKIDWVEVVNLAQGGMKHEGLLIMEHSFRVKSPEKRYQVFVYDGLNTDDNYVIRYYLFRNDNVIFHDYPNFLINNYHDGARGIEL